MTSSLPSPFRECMQLPSTCVLFTCKLWTWSRKRAEFLAKQFFFTTKFNFQNSKFPLKNGSSTSVLCFSIFEHSNKSGFKKLHKNFHQLLMDTLGRGQ